MSYFRFNLARYTRKESHVLNHQHFRVSEKTTCDVEQKFFRGLQKLLAVAGAQLGVRVYPERLIAVCAFLLLHRFRGGLSVGACKNVGLDSTFLRTRTDVNEDETALRREYPTPTRINCSATPG